MYRIIINGQKVMDNNGKGYSRSTAISLANQIRRYDHCSAIAEEMKED